VASAIRASLEEALIEPRLDRTAMTNGAPCGGHAIAMSLRLSGQHFMLEQHGDEGGNRTVYAIIMQEIAHSGNLGDYSGNLRERHVHLVDP
jgi:hypothetical protein